MATSNAGIGRKQRRELALAQQAGELATVPRSPRCTPMLEENPGMCLDGEPSVGRCHGPVLTDAERLGDESDLVGLVTDVLDDRVRDHEVERAVRKGQMPAIGDQEVAPGDRVFGAAVETFEQNAAGHEHVDGLGHAVCDDVLEGLILPRLNTHDQHALGIDGPNDGFEPIGLAVAVIDAESTGGGRDEVAHRRSLWQPTVAKPIAVLLLALAALVVAACSSVTTEEANRSTPPQASDPVDQPAQVDEAPTEAAELDDEAPELEDEEAAVDTDDADAPPRGDRGSRAGSDEELAASESESAPVDPDASEDPVATPEPETIEAPAEATEPTPTPVATTEPLATPVPLATAAPVTAPAPTVPVAPPPSQDPDAAFTAPAPTGPVPSDDIVVQGPDVDESLPVVISDRGAAACALTESAIEFVDVGDLSRTAAVLQEASQVAGQASEPEIASMATQLAAAGANEEAAIAAIIATLNACAIHGYQV